MTTLVELEPVETTLDYTGILHFPGPPFFFETNEQFATITPLTARMLDRNLPNGSVVDLRDT